MELACVWIVHGEKFSIDDGLPSHPGLTQDCPKSANVSRIPSDDSNSLSIRPSLLPQRPDTYKQLQAYTFIESYSWVKLYESGFNYCVACFQIFDLVVILLIKSKPKKTVWQNGLKN